MPIFSLESEAAMLSAMLIHSTCYTALQDGEVPLQSIHDILENVDNPYKHRVAILCYHESTPWAKRNGT